MHSVDQKLILTAATYGSINTNSKCGKKQSDKFLIDFGLEISRCIPQKFNKKDRSGKLVLKVAKIVDYLKIAGNEDIAKHFSEIFKDIFKLGPVKNCLGTFRFLGLKIDQNNDLSIESDADDKLRALVDPTIAPNRRNEPDGLINTIE